MRTSRLIRLISALALVSLMVGCGEPTGFVSGEVRFAGAPLPYGQITMFREDGRSASSVIDNGYYEIHKVPVGTVTITIQSLPPPPMRTMMYRPDGSEGAGTAPAMPEKLKQRRIPERYRDPTKSGLALTIEGGEQTHDIDLTP
ncbi:hypothetical protein AYO40_06130 [Planctomycetaceae bacterium SCGC AG-212-D15]|nr:hypothetical protein AYO40_06130 [Planctomycetaceae bacterium SCGC AG-212-D15]